MFDYNKIKMARKPGKKQGKSGMGAPETVNN